MAFSTNHADSRSITYPELPAWVRRCFENKDLDGLPEGIKSSVSSHIDLARASINHARFHPRYVIFFIDDIEPEPGVIARRFELTLPFKSKGVPRSRIRLRATEERIYFIHADWTGEYDGWDYPPSDGPGELVRMEERELRSPESADAHTSTGFEIR